MRPGVDTGIGSVYFRLPMNTFPFPAEPSETQNLIEGAVGRWLLVGIPVLLIGHVLGALALVASLMSANFNILSWVE